MSSVMLCKMHDMNMPQVYLKVRKSSAFENLTEKK